MVPSYSVQSKCVQIYLGDITGLLPDHYNKASHTWISVSQCI